MSVAAAPAALAVDSDPVQVTIAVPITVPDGLTPLLTAEQLATYTRATGTLTRQLDAVAGTPVADGGGGAGGVLGAGSGGGLSEQADVRGEPPPSAPRTPPQGEGLCCHMRVDARRKSSQARPSDRPRPCSPLSLMSS